MHLQDIAGFAQRDRAVAQRGYDLTTGFGIVDIVPGSAAERAGLQRRDEIVELNGVSLASFAAKLIRRKASYDRIEAFEDLLQSALQRGGAELVVRRFGRRLAVRLAPDWGCGGRFVVLPSGQLNAWSDGKYVAVTSKMIHFSNNDSELAFVVAHEMAHNLLGHNDRGGKAAFTPPEPLLTGGGSREAQADELALQIMDRAGFDPSAAAALLRRARPDHLQFLSLTHPSMRKRIARVEESAGRFAGG